MRDRTSQTTVLRFPRRRRIVAPFQSTRNVAATQSQDEQMMTIS